MSGNYYNEWDKKTARWLRNLIADGLIPAGDVDERSISDVQTEDLRGYTQCHFFAGIGGWPYALQIAGWPADRPVWTGSCPCQPFSVAGRGAGTRDARHLWPDMFRLVRAARPAVVLGEQVAGSAGYGWFDGVSADLEGSGYACRAVNIPACAVNAPHIRNRLYWCAVADTNVVRGLQPQGGIRNERGRATNGDDGRVEHAPGLGWREGRSEPVVRSGRDAAPRTDAHSSVEHAHHERREEQRGAEPIRAEQRGAERADGGGQWDDYAIIACHDGKTRRAQSAIPLLVDGFSGRVAAWRGLGNAIVPPLAAEVIRALMECDECP